VRRRRGRNRAKVGRTNSVESDEHGNVRIDGV
jgi:hypothetical protein